MKFWKKNEKHRKEENVGTKLHNSTKGTSKIVRVYGYRAGPVTLPVRERCVWKGSRKSHYLDLEACQMGRFSKMKKSTGCAFAKRRLCFLKRERQDVLFEKEKRTHS